MKKKYGILFLLVLVYLINGICSINAISVTFDEGAHFSYGIRILKGRPARVDPENDNSKMPISALNALPRAVEQLFSKNLKKDDGGVSDIVKGRYLTLLFSVLIIILVFVWSRDLYGINAGLFSAFLFVCCPNNMANAILVTTDTYSVFFLLATMYFLWRYANSRAMKDFIFFTIFLAFSQLVKQSLFHLYVLAPVCLLVYALVMREKIKGWALLKKIVITAMVSLLIINAGFLFYDMTVPVGNYHFRSNLFLKVQQLLPGGLPIPFSRAFTEGLDLAKYYDDLGGGLPNSSMSNVTVLGQSFTGSGIWYYYLVSIFFKTPITFLILLVWAVSIKIKKESFNQFIKNEFFLTAPILYFLILLSFFYKSQAGIRHIIFIYPLIFIFCGIIIKYARGKKDKGLLLILGLLLLMSVGQYFNNYHPYTNEFIGHKKNAYQYVGAGNINLGQAGYFIQDYLKEHPEVRYAPKEPKAGKFIISVDNYLDTWNTGEYQWLRKLKPVADVHYSYLLFEVQSKDIDP